VTSRERVLKAVNHEEADRVPIDLGGTLMSGIMASAYGRLKKHLGLDAKPPRVYELYQMLAEVEEPVLKRLHCDVAPLDPLTGFFEIKRERWKPWLLFDGTVVEAPGDFRATVDPATGDLLLPPGGDTTRPPMGRMPKGGFYFDMIGSTQAATDFKPPAVEDYKRGLKPISDEELDHLRKRAEHLHHHTDYAVLGGWWGGGLGGVGTFADWMCLLVTEKAYVHDIFAAQVENAVRSLERYSQAVGDDVDILGVSGHDFGTQKGELLSPALFAELYAPHFKRINDWIHQHTRMKTFFHCCGSMWNLLPIFVEMGVDIVNPVQCSAANMDPRRLKERFGKQIAFWGGGVDTQKTLPFGTPDEVRAEVAERIRVFAPGGGFVFNAVHNIQHGTPPENIVAAYDAAAERGVYPIQ